MADIKFSCPSCGQHIQCEDQWAGRQIACPACAASLAVPQIQAAPAPVPTVAPAPAPSSSPSAPTPGSPAPAARRLVPRKKPFPVKALLLWTAGVAVFVVGMIYLLRGANVLQRSFNKNQKEIVANSSGGELTHIANVYQVLDATDPAKAEAAQIKAHQRAERERGQMIEALKVKADPTLALPLATPAYALDASVTVPDGRVNGSSAQTPFKVETVHLDPNSAGGGVLAFQEGVGSQADHEIFIYLDTDNITNLAGRSWTVDQNTRGKGVPQVVKRWTINPKFAPVPKTFSSGYVLRLQFAQPTRDWETGQIYLALPDPGHTVLAGSFSLPMPRSPQDEKALQMLRHMRY